ncbi:hypothetical protein QZH41_005377 [Actinostola sp. cb2023]|nr:hypothetical protein QZH41_005377 [Actinostola sp. cb2023]
MMMTDNTSDKILVKAKATMEKMKKEKSQKGGGGQMKHFLTHDNETAYKKVLQHDSSPPTALISSITSKLSGFGGPLATRVRTKVTDLNTRWASMSSYDQTNAVATLGVVATNLEKFGDAGSNPIGAVQGAINIVGAISTFFGPVGQLVSIGLGFVSALLGLFGKGPKPKSMQQLVREQIDEALDEFRDETLTDRASGMIRAFTVSKSYLDGAAVSGEPLSENEMIIASTRVPMTQGSEFMGELATVIDRLLRENQKSDAKKCIKYCELYAQLAGLKDMMLTQMISMSSPAMQNDINGLMGYKQAFREGTRLLLEPLYTTDFGQKIMPYFDPDLSVITDSYATAVLNLGTYDRSMAGYYCLEGPSSNGMADLVWTTDNFLIRGKPFTKYVAKSNSNCYWKLVPHGSNIFSIVNKKDCDSNDRRCGWMLSWDSAGNDRAYINIDESDPVLWEINGHDWRRCVSYNFLCF